MPKFKKLVVTPGVHNVGRIDGRSEIVALTPARLKEWVDNTNKARKLGVKIPAPFAHQDKDRRFPMPVVLGTDGATLSDAYSGSQGISWDAQVNGGFWEDDFAIDPETGGIQGFVEAPGEENDPNTPAGKIGTTVKETSVFVMGPRKVVVNGVEHEIGEHLAHVAMCLHPAQPGQRNFEPLPQEKITDDLKLAMSFCMNDLVTANVGATAATTGATTLQDPTKPQDQELLDTITMLASVTYISLPPSTNRENFITNLNVCLRQKSADQQEKQKEEESLTQRPIGSATQSPSIAMSQTTQTTDSKNTSNDAVFALLMNNLVNDKKKSLTQRVNALVTSGRVAKTFADEKLLPRINSIVMSAEQIIAANGAAPRDPVEDLIEGLEASQPLTGTAMSDNDGGGWQTPTDVTVETNPTDTTTDAISDKDADEIIGEALQFA